jgi:hypothetical protein
LRGCASRIARTSSALIPSSSSSQLRACGARRERAATAREAHASAALRVRSRITRVRPRNYAQLPARARALRACTLPQHAASRGRAGLAGSARLSGSAHSALKTSSPSPAVGATSTTRSSAAESATPSLLLAPPMAREAARAGNKFWVLGSVGLPRRSRFGLVAGSRDRTTQRDAATTLAGSELAGCVQCIGVQC